MTDTDYEANHAGCLSANFRLYAMHFLFCDIYCFCAFVYHVDGAGSIFMFLGCLFACAYMFFVHAILHRLAVNNFLFLFKFVMSLLLQLLTALSKLLSPSDEFFYICCQDSHTSQKVLELCL